MVAMARASLHASSTRSSGVALLVPKILSKSSTLIQKTAWAPYPLYSASSRIVLMSRGFAHSASATVMEMPAFSSCGLVGFVRNFEKSKTFRASFTVVGRDSTGGGYRR